RLWIVAQVRDGYDLTRAAWQLSYDLVEKPDGYQLNAVAVVPKSATICLPPIEVRDGTLAQLSRTVVYQDGAAGELIRHAEQTQRSRRGGRLLIGDVEREKWLEQENERIARDYRSWPPNSNPARGQVVPPQMRPGWKPGDLEWSQAGGKVLSVR